MEYTLSLDSCRSADDSFYIYERYMRSFQRSDPIVAEYEHEQSQHSQLLPAALAEIAAPTDEVPCVADERSLTTERESLIDNDSSNKAVAASSDDTTRSDTSCRQPKPAIIASLVSMENSNNATDGGRLFAADPVFKLPNNELTFNGTLKHLQKLKPIVDPSAALSKIDYSSEVYDGPSTPKATPDYHYEINGFHVNGSELESGNMEYNGCIDNINPLMGTKDESWSSVGASKGRESVESGTSCGGPPSPDMFSEEEEWSTPHSRLQEYLTQQETYDKSMLKKMEKTLSGVLPPPSVTTLKTDVHEMLRKYYANLPLFQQTDPTNINSTPSKGVSCGRIPTEVVLPEPLQDTAQETRSEPKSEVKTVSFSFMNLSVTENTALEETVPLNASDVTVAAPVMGKEEDARNMLWPLILKCRYHDVHYNVSSYSERMERAASRVAQRYVGDEMASSCTVFSSASQSPTSAQKRKALRVKMAQNKSPGRRLSHLARRRQAFFSASSLAEKTQGTSKMVLIDKNFFPHRKLTYTSERKSPRTKRTPGRKTPGKKTPGKKTPGRSSSKKKMMRRLVIDTELATRSQPTRESSRRALFQSPEEKKVAEPPMTTNARAFKSKRALFGSPESNVGKSLDGIPIEGSAKRKRDSVEEVVASSSCKLQKSLSFGGEVVKSQPGHTSLARRATEMFPGRKTTELNSLQKQKLLWAVSNALRAHGWRMGAPGFKEKASALAQLTRRLLVLPQHTARLAACPSTSDYMLRLARKYVFSVIQGCSIEECYREEQLCLANENSTKLTGYISVAAYQQMKSKTNDLPHTFTSSRIKENTCDSLAFKADQPKSATKNILQDKLVNIDSNSNSTNFSISENSAIFKSNSMPSFKDTAKMRARRQISFDDIDDAPKR